MTEAKGGGDLAASGDGAEASFLIHLRAGDLEQASRSCDDPGTARMIRSTRAMIATVKAVRVATGDADVADACTRILQAIAQLSRNWVARTPAQMPEDVPGTEAELNRLLVGVLEDGHYYQPVPLSGVEGRYTSLVTPAYLEQAWNLLRPLLPELKGTAVLEVGPAEGFFTTRFARAGAEVTAIERNLLMAVRAITFCALNRLQDRVRVHLGAFTSLAPRLREAPDLVVALGIIYHFVPLEQNLDLLVRFRRPIALEFNGGEPTSGFDPASYKDSQGVPDWWLERWLDARGFDVAHCHDWTRLAADLSGGLHRNQRMMLAQPRD